MAVLGGAFDRWSWPAGCLPLAQCGAVRRGNRPGGEGGIINQQPDCLSLIDRCHAHGKPVVVGGPDVDRVAERREGTDGLYRLSVFFGAWLFKYNELGSRWPAADVDRR
jgi:hypothetical protein